MKQMCNKIVLFSDTFVIFTYLQPLCGLSLLQECPKPLAVSRLEYT